MVMTHDTKASSVQFFSVYLSVQGIVELSTQLILEILDNLMCVHA